MRGWAQWWPERTQMPSTSRIEAMSCGCAPSIVKDTTPALFLTSFGPYVVTPFKDRKSTRLNSSHLVISYAVFCLKKKKKIPKHRHTPSTQLQPRTPRHFYI